MACLNKNFKARSYLPEFAIQSESSVEDNNFAFDFSCMLYQIAERDHHKCIKDKSNSNHASLDLCDFHFS